MMIQNLNCEKSNSQTVQLRFPAIEAMLVNGKTKLVQIQLDSLTSRFRDLKNGEIINQGIEVVKDLMISLEQIHAEGSQTGKMVI